MKNEINKENITIKCSDKDMPLTSFEESKQICIKNICSRILAKGYKFHLRFIKEVSIRPTEASFYYLLFAIDGETKETQNLGIRFDWSSNLFHNPENYQKPIRINTNCEWSPKPLYI